MILLLYQIMLTYDNKHVANDYDDHHDGHHDGQYHNLHCAVNIDIDIDIDILFFLCLCQTWVDELISRKADIWRGPKNNTYLEYETDFAPKYWVITKTSSNIVVALHVKNISIFKIKPIKTIFKILPGGISGIAFI